MQQQTNNNQSKIGCRTIAVIGLLCGLAGLNGAAVAASATSGQEANTCNAAQLQGSWELHYAIYRDQSGKVVGEIKDQNTKSRKLIAGRHFSFFTWQPDGKFEVSASGTFIADATGYREQIDVTSKPKLQGKTYHFQCAITGDKWLHHGPEDGILIEEHWLRVSGGPQ